MRNVVIIGAGTAGLTAAIYTGRAMLMPLVIEGNKPGGQIVDTNELENFPGFPDGINGFDFTEKLRKQAMKFGAEFIAGEVKKIEKKGSFYKLITNLSEIETKTIIIATGSAPRKLGIPGEAEYRGKGVSYCAVCDGFFYRDKKVAVIGGGDTACQDALFLTKFAQKVYLIHRRDQLRASKFMAEKVKAHPKIEIIWDTIAEEIHGDKFVTSLITKNKKSGDLKELILDGVFMAIGHIPNTNFIKDSEIGLKLDEKGYLVLKKDSLTGVEGIFGAGDCADAHYQQCITAAGSACKAAIDCEEYLESKNKA